MHLGDGGVLVLKKQLNSSQSMNTHLESKLNEHSTTITIKRTQIEELNKKYQQVKHNNATLTATNEKQHKELLAQSGKRTDVLPARYYQNYLQADPRGTRWQNSGRLRDIKTKSGQVEPSVCCAAGESIYPQNT